MGQMSRRKRCLDGCHKVSCQLRKIVSETYLYTLVTIRSLTVDILLTLSLFGLVVGDGDECSSILCHVGNICTNPSAIETKS